MLVDFTVALDKLDKIGPIIATNLQEISRSIQETQDVLGPALVRTNQISMKSVLAISILCLIIALVAIVKILNNLNRISSEILKISSELSQNSNKVKSITDKTKMYSNRVAEASQEQAASLEETSSSLEEMDGMARKNLDSVRDANTDTSKMKEISDKANKHMGSLVTSMQDITQSNQRVEEISTVIQELHIIWAHFSFTY